MISNRCLYALRAVLELSRRNRSEPVTIGQIAEARGIPVRFLEAILRQLKQAGVVESVRGKEGGYYLARAPHKITMGEVIQLFEGPLVSINRGEEEVRGGREADDVFSPIWQTANRTLGEIFDHTDFHALAERDQERAFIEATNYTI